MNILHITTFLQGGAGRILKDLAVRQSEAGHNVTVAVSEKEEAGYENYKEYIDELNNHGIEICKLDSTFKRDIYKNINAVSKVNSIIVNKNINIIHSHAAVPSMAAMTAKANVKRYIPIIQTMHGWGTNKNQLQEKMDISILNLVDKVVTVSNADKKLLETKGVNKNKIEAIYNGLEQNMSDYILDDNIADNIQSFKQNSILLGCIGTVCSRKNQEIIIEALKYLKSSQCKVVFMGEGDIISELKDKAKMSNIQDKVEFLGYVENASRYIKYFDYVILPSLSEGLPMAVLEAYRESTPVIVSDIECFKEIVEDNKNGFIFDRGNEEELADIIDKAIILRDKKEYLDMCEYNKKVYMENYTMEQMIGSYRKLYKSLVL